MADPLGLNWVWRAPLPGPPKTPTSGYSNRWPRGPKCNSRCGFNSQDVAFLRSPQSYYWWSRIAHFIESERIFSPAVRADEHDPAQRSNARLGGGGSVSCEGVAFNAWSYSRKSSNVVSNSRRLASPAYSGELFTCAKCCNVSDRDSC